MISPLLHQNKKRKLTAAKMASPTVSTAVDVDVAKDRQDSKVKEGEPSSSHQHKELITDAEATLVAEANNCRFLEFIGEGGFANIFLVWQKAPLERAAVLKGTPTQKIRSQYFVSGLKAEGELMMRLRHPNIVQAYDHWIGDDGTAWIMMEYASCALESYLTPTFVPEFINKVTIPCIMRQILAGVGYIHEQGIAHQDLHVNNFLLNVRGEVKITDFGSAVTVSPTNGEAPFEHARTPMPYRAPEVLTSQATIDQGVDVWAVGIVFVVLCADKKSVIIKEDSRLEQLKKLSALLGPPHEANWPDIVHSRPDWLMNWITDYRHPMPAHDPKTMIPDPRRVHSAEDWRDLIRFMLVWDRRKRPKISQVLKHPYFTQVHPPEKDVRQQFAGGDSALKKLGLWEQHRDSMGYTDLRGSTTK